MSELPWDENGDTLLDRSKSLRWAAAPNSDGICWLPAGLGHGFENGLKRLPTVA